MSAAKVTAIKSPLKYHGGKGYLASWVLSHFPARESYTHYIETHAGSLAVLLAHDPAGKAEVVNDLDGDLTNFWFVLGVDGQRLIDRLTATPLAEPIWQRASAVLATETDPVERAWAYFVRMRQSRQGLGACYCTPTQRLRRGMNENVSSWWTAVARLSEARERLARVEIRCMDACKLLDQYDHPQAMVYLDPPYMHATRVAKACYRYEMSEAEHQTLLLRLAGVRGRFALSGYRSELYDRVAAANGWRRVERQIDNKASSAAVKASKTECLWMNY